MGQCTFGSGCRYTHPKDVVPPKPQCPPVLEEYVEEDPRVSKILKKASLTEFEKQRQIREIQRQGKTETTSSATSKMSASSQSWTPSSSSSQPYIPLNLTSNTTTTMVKPDFVLTSVPKDVRSVLPESLTRRVQLITNEICKNVQILDSEDDTLGLDDVISILLPLEEVSSLLRDQEPVNGKTITYAVFEREAREFQSFLLFHVSIISLFHVSIISLKLREYHSYFSLISARKSLENQRSNTQSVMTNTYCARTQVHDCSVVREKMSRYGNLKASRREKGRR